MPATEGKKWLDYLPQLKGLNTRSPAVFLSARAIMPKPIRSRPPSAVVGLTCSWRFSWDQVFRPSPAITRPNGRDRKG